MPLLHIELLEAIIEESSNPTRSFSATPKTPVAQVPGPSPSANIEQGLSPFDDDIDVPESDELIFGGKYIYCRVCL